MLLTAFCPFLTLILPYERHIKCFEKHLILLSANAFNLDKAKVLLSGKG